jgi:hypothetical protein
MTHEQLVNWICCATLYHFNSGDTQWLKSQIKTLKSCLKSMLNRDNPNPKQRNGIMGYDSYRTEHGAEITTYDSLDVSLGQARNNIYIAVKAWASYLAMNKVFMEMGLKKEAKQCLDQAQRAATTITSFLGKDGTIPAVMGENCSSKIIPAIEGLVFPQEMGFEHDVSPQGPYGELIKALKTHFISVFKKGICIYDDNGWKLSNSADNSWLSKIYLCQYVARKVLKVKTPATGALADKAHQAWLMKSENLYWAWSDQMSSGVAMGSKYYPRGVTNILWLKG